MSNNRRLQNEINELINCVEEGFTVTYTKPIIKLYFPKEIEIHIDRTYPFTPPQIWIKNVPYKKYRTINSSRIQNYFTELGYDCLCCSSIANRENWSPCYHISKILTEINELNTVKQYIKYKIATANLMKQRKELPEDVSTLIESFLFRDVIYKDRSPYSSIY